MRYLLAIGGIVLLLVLGVAGWLLWPRAPLTAAPAQAAEAAPAQVAQAAPEAPSADSNGEGSLRVCNQTGNPVSIALGYRAERGWQSEGWWVAQPSECKTVYNGRLDARYYYVFAADDIGGGSWDGQFFMCTRDETFTIFGVEDCLARGYERTGFFEVDTKNRSDWTLQLTDNEVLGGEAAPDDEAAPLEDDSGSGSEPSGDEETPPTEGDETE